MSLFEDTNKIATFTSQESGESIIVDLSKLHYIRNTLRKEKDSSILSLNGSSQIEITESFELVKKIIFEKQFKSNNFFFVEVNHLDEEQITSDGLMFINQVIFNTKLVSAFVHNLNKYSVIHFDEQGKNSLLIEPNYEQVQKIIEDLKKKQILVERL